jgi:hypothetical protein
MFVNLIRLSYCDGWVRIAVITRLIIFTRLQTTHGVLLFGSGYRLPAGLVVGGFKLIFHGHPHPLILNWVASSLIYD